VSDTSSQRAAGLAIAVSAVVSLIALAFDQGPSSSDFREILRQLAALASVRGAVHAVEIACLAGLAAGYAAFAARLDLRRPAVLAGLVAFLAGCLMMMVTAMFDGFITQGVAARYAEAGPEQIEVARGLLRLCGIVVEFLGDGAFVLMAAGAAIWSVLLCRAPGMARLAGLIGLAGGGATIVMISLNPKLGLPMLMGIVFAQMLWYLSSALVLIRGRLPA
jgi:hypothetical protein